MQRNDTGLSIFSAHQPGAHEGLVPVDILRGKKFVCTTMPAGETSLSRPAVPWRMSPFGIDLVDEAHLYSIGDLLTVEVHYGQLHSRLSATVIARPRDNGRQLASLRFAKRTDGSSERRPRADTRWKCDAFYAPVVQTKVDGQFASVIYFRADEISLRGMKLLTSARNRKIVPGAELRAEISFPLGGTVEALLRVAYVEWAKKDSGSQLMVGVEVEGGKKAYVQHAGQYLLEFGSHEGVAPSPRALREVGFITKARGAQLEFSYVRSRAEYEEVLRLRALSFAENEEGRQWTYWADKFDTHSRILVGRFRGKILCSGRITFQENSDSLEQSAYVTMPPVIPRQTQLTEINRVCTHPDYRGEDLMAYLFRFVVLTMLESKERYMVINCTDQLLRMYESIGCKRTGTSFVHPNDKRRHHVLFSDIHQTVFGRKIHPLKWMLTMGEIWDDILPYVPSDASRIDRARLRILLRTRPLLGRLLAETMKRRRRPAAKSLPPDKTMSPPAH